MSSQNPRPDLVIAVVYGKQSTPIERSWLWDNDTVMYGDSFYKPWYPQEMISHERSGILDKNAKHIVGVIRAWHCLC